MLLTPVVVWRFIYAVLQHTWFICYTPISCVGVQDHLSYSTFASLRTSRSLCLKEKVLNTLYHNIWVFLSALCINVYCWHQLWHLNRLFNHQAKATSPFRISQEELLAFEALHSQTKVLWPVTVSGLMCVWVFKDRLYSF